MSMQPPTVKLATAGYDRQIRFWSPSDGSCRHTIPFQDSQINRLAISPQKTIIAAAGNPNARLFDIESREQPPVYTCEGHTSNVTAIGFQRHGRWLYTGSEDGTVKIWDTRVRGAQRTSKTGSPVHDVALHPDQAELITVCRDGTVKVWDLLADKCRKELPAMKGADSALQAVSVMADASLMVTSSKSGSCHVWDLRDNYKFVKSFKAHSGYILQCLFSPDLKTFATASSDSTVKLWSVKGGEFTNTHTLSSHRKWVWDCAFSADSAYLLTASSDCSARLWELQRGIVIRQFTQQMKAVVAVALNDSERVVSSLVP